MRQMLVVVGLMVGVALPAQTFGAEPPLDTSARTGPMKRVRPTTEAGPGQTVDGAASFDGVPLDVDVTLPAQRATVPSRRS